MSKALEARLLDLHTQQPGRVVTFYADTYEADVQLMCRRPVPHADGGYVYEDAPVIPRAQVCCLGNATSWMKVNLAEGDLVWVMFPEVSTAEFVDSGGEISQPADVTRHGLLGAMVLPYLLPSQLTQTASGPLVSLAGGADWAARADRVDARIGALEQHYIGHTHQVAVTVGGVLGSGSAATVAPPLTPGESTACDEVRIT